MLQSALWLTTPSAQFPYMYVCDLAHIFEIVSVEQLSSSELAMIWRRVPESSQLLGALATLGLRTQCRFFSKSPISGYSTA